jgi:hypothetical protein
VVEFRDGDSIRECRFANRAAISASGWVRGQSPARRTAVDQEELSEKAGMRRTCLRDFGRGGHKLSVVNVERLATALSIGLAELFRRVEADR